MNLLRRIFRRGFGFPAHLCGVKPVDSSGLVAGDISGVGTAVSCGKCHTESVRGQIPRWCRKYEQPEGGPTIQDFSNGKCL